MRGAYVTALAVATGVPVWSKKVPKDVDPIPLKYILITSQTKNRTEVDKDGFEWLCTITVDIYNVNEAGYSSIVNLDDIEENVINTIEEEIQIPGFITKSTVLFDSRDLETETASQSIERRILTYQHWLNNID